LCAVLFSLLSGPTIPCPRMRLEGASSVNYVQHRALHGLVHHSELFASDKECYRKSIEHSSTTRTRDQSTRSRCALHGKDATHNEYLSVAVVSRLRQWQTCESDRVSADARAKETGSTFGRGRKRRGLSQREARSTKRAPWLAPFCLGQHNRTTRREAPASVLSTGTITSPHASVVFVQSFGA
jgi:hypothetical protein